VNIEHKNDISIGRDRWIVFGNVDGLQARATNIDPLIQPLNDLWQALETQCVSECCGIDAFDFWREEVLKNTKHLDQNELLAKLYVARDEVLGVSAVALVSQRLNNYFLAATFIKLLDHLISVYKNVE
jgi:Family of unknown function (DUF6331)